MTGLERRPQPRSFRAVGSIALGIAAWLALVVGGFVELLRYGTTPGAEGNAPTLWPRSVSLRLDPLVPTLIMFAHPRCPCTAASLGELDRVMARCVSKLAATVVFYADKDRGQEWARTELWDHAACTPGVAVTADPGGALALTFGAVTSGVVRVYSPAGILLFSGGITASRGHEGDNPGATAVEAIAIEGATGDARMPVFGCPLQDPGLQGCTR